MEEPLEMMWRSFVVGMGQASNKFKEFYEFDMGELHITIFFFIRDSHLAEIETCPDHTVWDLYAVNEELVASVIFSFHHDTSNLIFSDVMDYLIDRDYWLVSDSIMTIDFDWFFDI